MPAPKFHPASLVPAVSHSPDVLQLVQEPVSKPLVDYLVDAVAETVDYAMGRSASSTASSSKPSSSSSRQRSQFPAFVNTVLTRAEVTTPVILTSLVYISRARPHLHIALEEWALERVFLGALIVSSKYLNDSTLKNVHWALCTGVFGKRDVGRIEREFLDVLDFELGVREEEILGQREGIREYRRRAGKSAVVAAVVAASPSIPETLSSPRKAPSPPASTAPTRNHRRSHHHHLPIPTRREASYSPSSSSDSSSEGSVSPQTPSSNESSPLRGRSQAAKHHHRPYTKPVPIHLQLPGLGTHEFPIRLDVDVDGDVRMS